MESLSIPISAPPELPRSKMRSTAMAVSGRAKSRATSLRTYSARDTPSSLARWRARRCTSFSSVIWVRDIMMATSYHCSAPRPRFNLGVHNRGQRAPGVWTDLADTVGGTELTEPNLENLGTGRNVSSAIPSTAMGIMSTHFLSRRTSPRNAV